jgi:hypothetical protein
LWKLFAVGEFTGQGVELAEWARSEQLLLMIFGSIHQSSWLRRCEPKATFIALALKVAKCGEKMTVSCVVHTEMLKNSLPESIEYPQLSLGYLLKLVAPGVKWRRLCWVSEWRVALCSFFLDRSPWPGRQWF